MTEPTNELLPPNEAGMLDETVSVTILTAVDEWRIQNDPADLHGVGMPEYICQALADAGLLADRAEVERLTAEVALTRQALKAEDNQLTQFRALEVRQQRDRFMSIAGQRAMELGQIRGVLVEADPKAELPGYDYVKTVDVARAIVGQRDEARMALEYATASYEKAVAERDEALSALAEQQALLARAVLVWPQDAMVKIRECIADPSRMGPRQDETVADWGARAVLKLLESWRVFSTAPTVEGARSATSEATPARHEVRMHPCADRFHAKCGTCGEFRCGEQAEAEDWKDQHEADTLRPQAFADHDLTDVKPGTGFFVEKDSEPPTRAIMFWEPGERVEYDLNWDGRVCAVPGAVIGDGGTNTQGVHRTAVRTGRMMLGDVYIENHLLRCPRDVTEFCGAFDIATDVSMKPCHERALPDSNRCARHSPAVAATEAEPSGSLMTECPDGAQCHRECVAPKCIRVATCGPMSRVFPSDRWPVEIIKKHGLGVSGEADTSPRPRVWREGDPEPEEDVELMSGLCTWLRGKDRLWCAHRHGKRLGGNAYTWSELTRIYDLTEVLPVSSPQEGEEA